MKSILLLVLMTLIFSNHVCAQTDQEKQLFDFMNAERKRESQAPLVWDDEVYKVALDHSKDMASHEITSHTGSDGKQPDRRVRDAGIFASKTAENIARDINIISAHTNLMTSLYHRENILDPGFTHAAVAIVKRDDALYVTEVFIRKVDNPSLREARRRLIRNLNQFRQSNKLEPVVLSNSLSEVAQSHIDVQDKFDSMTPLLTMGVLGRSIKGAVLVNVYTSVDLDTFPNEVKQNLQGAHQMVGIGFKRVRGSLCAGGCYFIAFIFS